ncbi:MAG: histidinol-phosphatase [Bacteroidia bacterium]|nr:histidinol-phosphatase [Bacteroidia bacterium]
MPYKTDYHIHTTFSDGKSAPEDYISRAVASGISEIGFSEHLSLFRDNKEWCMDPDNVGNYINYTSKLRNDTKSIVIKTGLEIDFIPGIEKETGLFLDNLALDYRIGSVHYLGEKTVDLGPEFYEGKNIDRLYESYFENVVGAVSSELYDIIGHCDLIRIYGYKPSFNPEPLYRKLADVMKKYDVAFELNTNGRNRPLADFYPDRRFLHIFSEKKVPVCVNSDAHFPARVGQYFDEAYELLRSSGYKEMAVFTGRKRKMKPL